MVSQCLLMSRLLLASRSVCTTKRVTVCCLRVIRAAWSRQLSILCLDAPRRKLVSEWYSNAPFLRYIACYAYARGYIFSRVIRHSDPFSTTSYRPVQLHSSSHHSTRAHYISCRPAHRTSLQVTCVFKIALLHEATLLFYARITNILDPPRQVSGGTRRRLL